MYIESEQSSRPIDNILNEVLKVGKDFMRGIW